MNRSWSSIVRGTSVLASKLNAEAPVFVPKPRCLICSDVAEVCRRCEKNAVYEKNLCGMCLYLNTPSDSMCIGYVHTSNNAHMMPHKCKNCRLRDAKKSPLKTGPVTIQEFLAGQPVTGEQFFAAIRATQ